MDMSDVAAQRLHNEHLLNPLADPVEVVRSLGCVQAQDFPGAKWALGMRTKGVTDEAVTQLFNEGKILRTHILRPTWHFVAPEDIRWIQDLTAPRVHAFSKYYRRKLELDEATLHKSAQALAQALAGGNQLIRKEVDEVFRGAGIDTSGLRLGFLIMYAELEAVVCSGAMRGKQHTLALVSERAPQAKVLPREQALQELCERFFASHGPATVQDFAWWSSLTVTDTKQAIQLASLRQVEVDGTVFYYTKQASTDIPSPTVHLLPNFDEYTVPYKERRPLMQAKLDRTPTHNDLYFHLIIIDGQLVGGWRRINAKKNCTVQLNLFTKLNAKQTKALDDTIAKLESFLQLPVAVSR